MKKFLVLIKNRVFAHWITTVKGVTYGIITLMLYERNITPGEWILMVGTIMTVDNIFLRKDPNKTESKTGYSSSPKDDHLKQQ